MLFWIFVIIAVVSGILFRIFSIGTKELKQLEWAKQVAHNNYFSFSPSYKNKEELELHQRFHKEYLESEKAYDDAKNRRKNKDTYRSIAGGFVIFALIVIFIMSLALLIINGSAGGQREQLEANYEVLSWEVENNIYQDGGDDVVGKKELYNQVREWNSELKKNQYYEKNFWVGIFVPNIYSDLKPIELK